MKPYSQQSSYEEVNTILTQNYEDNARSRTSTGGFNERGERTLKSENLMAYVDDKYFGGSSPKSKPRKERKTMNSHIKFVDKSQWTDEKVCFVCLKDFEKMKDHHCRACGHRVCGDCSDLRVNDRRVCEICFRKQENQDAEYMKQQLLNMKDQKEKEAQEQLEILLKQSNKMQEDIIDYENQLWQLDKEQGNKILSTEQEVLKLKEKLQAFKDKKARLIQNIQDNYAAIENKKAKLKGIKMKLSILKLEVNQKRAIYEQKSENFQLIQLKTDLEDAANDTTLIKTEFSGSRNARRNFSLSDSVKDGKYNVASNPVKI